VAVVTALTLLAACGPATGPVSSLPPVTTSAEAVQTPSGKYLTPNPVETSMPVYGGILKHGLHHARLFDAHQLVGYGATSTLPTFNQLVIFNMDYKDTVPENIIGDLAESWETSDDGLTITFNLHQGVKWHDGVPFTADDVIYSFEKMTDVKRSAISDWFPAYQSAEKINDYTLKVNLKYASAGFMIALAQGESQIQARHLEGVDPTSGDFMVGTGPFILEEYMPRVLLKWKRNPDYFKYDQYGNRLPYLDGIEFYQVGNASSNEMLVGRRLDLKSPTTGAATVDTYEYLTKGAPELLWQQRLRDNSITIYLNISKKPLDDVRVRRAIALIMVPEDILIGYSGSAMFGIPGQGLLSPSFGVSHEEVARLLGWDKPYEERVAEAQRLMAEAGYPDGFKTLNLMALGSTSGQAGGATQVLADAMRKYLKIESEMFSSTQGAEIYKRIDENNYDVFTGELRIGQDPAFLKIYFGSGGYANYARYSNPELDRILEGLDRITDPDQRREAIWSAERILLTDLPALPTGAFNINFMPYYPHVKNMRWNDMSYSNINRLEDVWLDESLRIK